ncbi:MAG: helix-turn-helix transcriptional regulator [Bryobacteraceae bacterium]
MHKEELRIAFGKTVRALRKEKGLAQEALAHMAGVDRGYMGGLERGEHTPTLDTLFKLLPHLGVDFAGFAAILQANLKRGKRKPGR